MCENKEADQLRSNCEGDQRLCFLYIDTGSIIPLKFPASSHHLGLYRLVCVGPVRKPHCWFCHDLAQMLYYEKNSRQPRSDSQCVNGPAPCWCMIIFCIA